MDFLLVRHCQAEGQEPDAPLTELGRQQAQALATNPHLQGVRRIVSSPFARAVQTATPLAERLRLPIDVDPRLSERVLCGDPRPDWRDLLRESFADLDRCWPGGESSQAAMDRAVAAVTEALRHGHGLTAFVSHGCLLTLLLKSFDRARGFADWERMTTPDLYRVTIPPGDDVTIRRLA